MRAARSDQFAGMLRYEVSQRPLSENVRSHFRISFVEQRGARVRWHGSTADARQVHPRHPSALRATHRARCPSIGRYILTLHIARARSPEKSTLTCNNLHIEYDLSFFSRGNHEMCQLVARERARGHLTRWRHRRPCHVFFPRWMKSSAPGRGVASGQFFPA